MRVDMPPTESTTVAGRYSFNGALETAATQEGIEGQTVDLVVDGAVVQSIVTGAAPPGAWQFSFDVEPGTHNVQATFAGTAEYDPSATPVYPITPSKIATVMEVTTPPPATADAGVPFPFVGALKEEVAAVGIVGATVNLYVGGTPVGSTATGVDGAWAFDVSIDTLGTHAVYAEFPGDATYLGCAKKLSTGWLPPAGLLAVAGGLVGIACLRH